MSKEALEAELSKLAEFLTQVRLCCDNAEFALSELDVQLEKLELNVQRAERLQEFMQPDELGPKVVKPAIARVLQPLQTAFITANQILTELHAPDALISDGVTEIADALDALQSLATDRSEDLVEASQSLVTLFKEQLNESVRDAVDSWESKATALEGTIDAKVEELSDMLSADEEELEMQLHALLEDVLGEKIASVSEGVSKLFDAVEEALDQVENLLAEGAEGISQSVAPVVEIQQAIAELRPALEVLL